MDNFYFLYCDPASENFISVVDYCYNVLPFSCCSFKVEEFSDGSLKFTFEFKPEAADGQ